MRQADRIRLTRVLGVVLTFALTGTASAQDVSEPPAPPTPSIGTMEPDMPQPQVATDVGTGIPAQDQDPVTPEDGLHLTVPDAEAAGAMARPETAPVPVPEPSITAPYFDALRGYVPHTLHDETEFVQSAADSSARFLRDGGPSIWAIAALSVITVAIILWKIWRLALTGAWSKGRARKAVEAYETGNHDSAAQIVDRRRGARSKVVRAAISARASKPETLAREDTLRVARNELAEAAAGLRALELIATIAPLLGLLGTVLGMIAAFQALQESGARADPALLAGGIWEALLTTAAGMAVAIPASAALSWFEAVIDRMRRDIEDAVTRIFVTGPVDLRTPGEPVEPEQAQGQPVPMPAE